MRVSGMLTLTGGKATQESVLAAKIDGYAIQSCSLDIKRDTGAVPRERQCLPAPGSGEYITFRGIYFGPPQPFECDAMQSTPGPSSSRRPEALIQTHPGFPQARPCRFRHHRFVGPSP